MRKKGLELLLVIIAIPIILVISFAKVVGWPIFVLIVAAIVGFIIWHKDKKRKERIAYLTEKYKDEELVNKIIDKCIWQGQTSEQLLDSLGNPVDIDSDVLKTKKREVWKYHCDGRNRYRLRITLENDKIVGWHQR